MENTPCGPHRPSLCWSHKKTKHLLNCVLVWRLTDTAGCWLWSENQIKGSDSKMSPFVFCFHLKENWRITPTPWNDGETGLPVFCFCSSRDGWQPLHIQLIYTSKTEHGCFCRPWGWQHLSWCNHDKLIWIHLQLRMKLCSWITSLMFHPSGQSRRLQALHVWAVIRSLFVLDRVIEQTQQARVCSQSCITAVPAIVFSVSVGDITSDPFPWYMYVSEHGFSHPVIAQLMRGESP